MRSQPCPKDGTTDETRVLESGAPLAWGGGPGTIGARKAGRGRGWPEHTLSKTEKGGKGDGPVLAGGLMDTQRCMAIWRMGMDWVEVCEGLLKK